MSPFKAPVQRHRRRGSQTKRNAFRSFLKRKDKFVSWTKAGRVFQTRGPAMLNDRSQKTRERLQLLLLFENNHFPGEPLSDGSPLVLLLHLFQKRTSGDSWHGVFMGQVSCQPTIMSKHRRQHSALTLASGLASSFLHPPPDFWRKACVDVFTPALGLCASVTVH